MRTSLFRVAGSAALAAGMLFAQTPAPPAQGSAPGQQRQWHRGPMLDRMASELNLTDDQKQQVKSILDSARQSAQPVAQQLRQDRQALRDAVQSGKSDANIDQLSGDVGNLTGQLTAIHTKAFAKIYALLTPDQRTKAQALHDRMRGMFMGGHAHGQGGGTGF